MLKNRKAQGMSVKIIIVAIIGLIILVAVVMMLTGKLGDFRSGSKNFGNIAKTCFQQTSRLPQETCPGGTIASSDSIATGSKCCGGGTPAADSVSGGGVTSDGGLFGIAETEDIKSLR